MSRVTKRKDDKKDDKKDEPKVESKVKPTPVTPTGSDGAAIAAEARKYVGAQYQWGGKGPTSFDCSGFVAYVVKKALGLVISPDSHEQLKVGRGVAKSEIAPGDILCWDTMGGREVRGGNACSHVGIALGGTQMMNCLNESMDCQISDISSDYWRNQVRFLGARRVSADQPKPDPKPDPKPVTLGAPSGTVPSNLHVAYGRGGPWSTINRWDDIFVAAGTRHKVSPVDLKCVATIESGGQMIWNQSGSGAYGVMQIKLGWQGEASKLGYDLKTPEGNIGFAAAFLGGQVPGVQGSTVRERFLNSYYPTGGLDVPGEDGHTPRQYLSDWDRLAAIINDAAGVTPEPEAKITFGNIKHPNYEKKIVDKPWEGAGFDRVSPRQIVGVCDHQWWGYGDKDALVRLFGTGGERQADALTDYSITFEGELVMLNDPRGTRSPWANGPANHLDGDGALYVRKLGVGAVNARLVSLENEGKGEPMSEAMLDVVSSLHAYWFDQAKVPYTKYPLNPNVGCVTHLQHWEFSPKECPFTGIRSQTNQLQDLVRGKLKAAQTGGATDPIPPVDPPEPDHDWLPDGMTPTMVEELFGTLIRHELDGSTRRFPFDSKGLISNAWLARGAEEVLYPEANEWWRISENGKVRNLVSFSNGWILEGDDGDRSSWRWRDDDLK